jgi:hypothetical protein
MGTSTNAILFYGIPINGDIDEITAPFDENDESYFAINDDWNKLKAPIKPTEPSFPDYDYTGPDWDTWRSAIQEYEKSPVCVQIDCCCSIDYPMFYVHGRQYVAYRGDVNEIDLEKLKTTPEDDAFIKEFCERYGVLYQQPKWYLVSYWG